MIYKFSISIVYFLKRMRIIEKNVIYFVICCCCLYLYFNIKFYGMEYNIILNYSYFKIYNLYKYILK